MGVGVDEWRVWVWVKVCVCVCVCVCVRLWGGKLHVIITYKHAHGAEHMLLKKAKTTEQQHT